MEITRKTRSGAWIFLLVWLTSCAYLGVNLKRGWEAHDEGTLGQTADRVLHGDIPHRDFDELYTGGLSYVNAFIFGHFGVQLLWLRLLLFAVFLAWVPALYALARQFLEPWAAGGVTLVGVAWSAPNYPAAMPSWYTLFLATFGILALSRYIRRPALYWLAIAGLCGGCSFLIKSVALYYIAAGLLFFVYREQTLSRNPDSTPRRTPIYTAFLLVCLFLFVCSLIKLVSGIGSVPDYVHFVLPGLAIALWLTAGERKPATVSSWSRFRSLIGMGAPFLLGAAVPIGLFFLFYWYHGALGALIHGLFVAPLRRVSFTRQDPPGLILESFSVIATLLFLETAQLRGRLRRFLSIFLALLAGVLLLTSRSQDASAIAGLGSAMGIIPVLVAAAVFVLSAKRHLLQSNPEGEQQLVLLLTMVGLCSLIQFPFSNVIYFCYVAPLAVLLAAKLISLLSRPPQVVLYATTAFYILFAVFILRPGQFAHLRREYAGTPLQLPRTRGIYVSESNAAEYEALIPFIQGLAGDSPIVAGGDCPQIYFLTGIKNPTRVLFEFLDTDDYQQEMKSLIDRPNFIRVAVINDATLYSIDQMHVLRALVIPRFPESRKIGSFTVYWRP